MIKELVQSYFNGETDKKEYGFEMFKQYEILFEYVSLLTNSDVQNIDITKEGVILKINSLSSENSCIYMHLFPEDSGSITSTCLSFGHYEKTELRMIEKIVSCLDNGGIVFDIGANQGWYTLNIKKINDKLQCYSFEPIKNIYNQLINNLKCNGLDTSRAINIGFYNTNTILHFYYNKNESGSSSLANLRQTDRAVKLECAVQKLDDFVQHNNINRLDFIKCDVEGAELFVFEGSMNTLKKFKPIIFTEMLRKWSAMFNYHPNDIIAMLSSIGYLCFIIDDNGYLIRLNHVDENTIATNYFFLHSEAHMDLINELTFSG